MQSVVYKRPINLPRSGHELITCHYPLRLDTYSGCMHNCVYCYAKNLLKEIGYWDVIRKTDIRIVEREIEKYMNDETKGDISEAIKKKVPFRLGGLTDCFQHIEKKERITRQVIELLNTYEYPYLIVTKSPLVAKYADIIEKNLAVIQITITTLDTNIAKKLETFAPSPIKRLEALKELNDYGYFTTARFSPLIPHINMNEVEKLMENFSEAGTHHVLVEFFRGTKKMINAVEKSTGINVGEDFVKNGYYYRFNLNKKLKIYKKLKEIANSFGLKFSICQDGDPVPFYLNDTLNCCGTDALSNFKGVEKVASMVYKEAKKKGRVTLKDMEKYWTPVPSVFVKAWLEGKFERFVYGLKWDENGEYYVCERERKNYE